MTSTLAEIDAARHPGRLVARLADASRLAGRFAHDFDNVLMGVMGFAELAQSSVVKGSESYQLLADLLRVANRGREATRQLHRFSHSGRWSSGASNVAAAWNAELADACEKRATKTSIQCDFPNSLPDVALPADDLRAVIGAVVANALEAAGDEGVVYVATEALESDDGIQALPNFLPPGNYLALTVTDDGPGFNPDVLALVAVTPFLTTKVRHRGLGLSIALLTLATHGGGLRIAPATPRGTAATIYLPTDRTDLER